jgi:hypothetical protein
MSFKNQKVSLRLLRQSTQKTVYHMVDKQVNPLLFKNRHKSLNYYQYKKDANNVQKAYIHTIKEKKKLLKYSKQLWFLLFLTGLCWINIFRNKKKK